MFNLHKNNKPKITLKEEKIMNNSNSQNNTRPVKKVSLSQKIKSLGYDILLGGKLIPFLLLNKLTEDVYNPFFDIDYKVSDSWCSYEKLKYNLDFKKKLLKNDDYAFKIVRSKCNAGNILIKILLFPLAILLDILILSIDGSPTNPYTDGKFHTASDYTAYRKYQETPSSFLSHGFFAFRNNSQILLDEQKILFKILACENVDEYLELDKKYPLKKLIRSSEYDDVNRYEYDPYYWEDAFFNPILEHTLYKMYIEENFDTKFRDISFLTLEQKFTLMRLELLKRGCLFENNHYFKSEYNKDYEIMYKELRNKFDKKINTKGHQEEIEFEIYSLLEPYYKELTNFVHDAKELESKINKLNLDITNNIVANNTSLKTTDCIEWTMNFTYQHFLNSNYLSEEKEIIFTNLQSIFENFYTGQYEGYIIEDNDKRYVVRTDNFSIDIFEPKNDSCILRIKRERKLDYSNIPEKFYEYYDLYDEKDCEKFIKTVNYIRLYNNNYGDIDYTNIIHKRYPLSFSYTESLPFTKESKIILHMKNDYPDRHFDKPVCIYNMEQLESCSINTNFSSKNRNNLDLKLV